MSQHLTLRQQGYLEFLRKYIAENRSAPRLEEIASHFGVRSPTAHKALETLQDKGYIRFGRESFAGFYIRLIERAGTAERLIEVVTVGYVNRYGELIDFPQKIRHFASIVPGTEPGEVFALDIRESIPEVNFLFGDSLICSKDKKIHPRGIAVLPFGRNGKRFLLCHIHSLVSDEDASQEQRFKWSPIAFSEETKDYFDQEFDKEGWPGQTFPAEFVLGTVLRMTRHLAF